MLYYINYNPAEDKRYVLAYDEEKHGKAQVVNDHMEISIMFLSRGLAYKAKNGRERCKQCFCVKILKS